MRIPLPGSSNRQAQVEPFSNLSCRPGGVGDEAAGPRASGSPKFGSAHGPLRLERNSKETQCDTTFSFHCWHSVLSVF